MTKPFLRWAGGKTWLTKEIQAIANSINYANYHEPFLGSGSIFFSLKPKNKSFLSDINNNLIETYIALRDDYLRVISELKKMNNTKDDYYAIRTSKCQNKWECAAKFIYLNQTSFNGIYRENLKGEYNVPYGYRKKDFINESELKKNSVALNNTDLLSCDFYTVIKNIKKNDLVFLDPPYTVSHNKNGFIKYNKKLFSIEDQYRLKDFIEEINAIGAHYILTNAAHIAIYDVFNKNSNLIELSRNSLIGGKNAKRGLVMEYLFTNINYKDNIKPCQLTGAYNLTTSEQKNHK
jgi:DNA adenine methylase